MAVSDFLSHPPMIDQSSPMGTYELGLLEKMMMKITRVIPFARGFMRKRVGLWIGHGKPIDTEIFGLKLRCYPGNTASERRALLDPVKHDKEEREAILTIALSLPKGEEFYFADVGANTGFYTLHLAANVPSAKILALEPVDHHVRTLKFNVETNNLTNVIINQVAASDSKGTAMFDPVDQSLAKPGAAPRIINEKPYSVPTDTLENCLTKAGFNKLHALKIDVEGYEDKVLFQFFENAPQSLWPDLVIIEHVCAYTWQKNCLDLLTKNKYEPTWVGRLNTVYTRTGNKDG